MALRTGKSYLRRRVALGAGISLGVLLFFAGIAAACGGGGGEPCSEAPTVRTTPPNLLTYSSTWINGDVEPNGCQTSWELKFRKSGGEWKTVASGNVEAVVPIEAVFSFQSGLSPSTKYEYTLSATNAKETATAGPETFTTPMEPKTQEKPAVTTEAATGIGSAGATFNGTVNPKGASTTYRFEYGTKEKELTKSTVPGEAGSGSVGVKKSTEVSLEPGTVYYFRMSATNSAGTTLGSEKSLTTSAGSWKIKETKNPGSSGNRLYDVSCEPSTSACTAVGKGTTLGVDSPIALRWNGTSWSEQTAAKKSGATHTRLFGVDCPSETRCLAVGNYQSSEGPSLLSELWTEGKWAVQTTPLPAESTASEFAAIGCNSTAECTAVGSAVIGGVKKAIAERWVSPTWSASTIPIPEGAKSSQLDGVDCLWSNLCVAVGRYTTSGGAIKSLVVFWNGSEWSLQSVTDPEKAAQTTLLDASCTPSPNRCMAVGGWKNSASEQFPLAYRFNGSTTWTLQSTPNPFENLASVLQEVSCSAESSCTGAGSWVSKAGGSNMTLAEAWNGTSWSIQGTPNPSGAVFSAFFGVSCRSTSCMGVGWSTNGSGVDSTLSEFRE